MEAQMRSMSSRLMRRYIRMDLILASFKQTMSLMPNLRFIPHGYSTGSFLARPSSKTEMAICISVNSFSTPAQLHIPLESMNLFLRLSQVLTRSQRFKLTVVMLTICMLSFTRVQQVKLSSITMEWNFFPQRPRIWTSSLTTSESLQTTSTWEQTKRFAIRWSLMERRDWSSVMQRCPRN